MMTAVIATSRMARQTNRWARFAVVTVEAVPAPADEVVVAQGVLRDKDFRHEAACAAREALRQRPSGHGHHRVTITHIQTSPVDTSVGDVHEATARAARKALSLNPPLAAGFNDPRLRRRPQLSTADPHPGYDMQQYGEIRVAPATAPDLMAETVGRQLNDAAVILGPFRRTACAGLLLRLDDIDVVIGTFCDEWIVALGQPPDHLAPHWRTQPWLAPG